MREVNFKLYHSAEQVTVCSALALVDAGYELRLAQISKPDGWLKLFKKFYGGGVALA